MQSILYSKPPTVSILIPVFNTSFGLVKRAINSVLSQDFSDFEIILIDDGSNNDPENQLLNYAKKYEDKITYFRHKNCGQSHSINKGLLIARGKYIGLLDSDDEYLSHHLNNCMEEINFVDLIASTTTTITDNHDDLFVPDKLDNKKLIHVDDCILFATLFGKKEVFAQLQFLGGYGADAHFFEEASKHFKVKKVNLRSYVYYRNIPGSICAKMKLKNNTALV